MTYNHYASNWVNDDYDFNNETFYVENARDLIRRPWMKGAIHGGIAIAAFIAVMLLGGPFLTAALLVSAMQIGFLLFAVLCYFHNDIKTSKRAYIASLVVFFFGAYHHPAAMIPICVVGAVLFVIFAIIVPINVYQAHKKFEAIPDDGPHWESDADEFEAWKRQFFNQDAYQESAEPSYMPDPNEELAAELFSDYGTTFAELKKRYRKLAKEYHPDHGGEEEVFKAIVRKYEILKMANFPNEK